MNVVYYSSDAFAEICGVSLHTLCDHNRDADSIDIFIIEDQISPRNKHRLQLIADHYDRNLHFIALPEQRAIFPDVNMNLGRTFARMIIARLLPTTVDRVLSLDSDTLILDSLSEMYSTDLEGNCIAGVYDCVGEGIQKKFLHADDDLVYCNAGVFLIDLGRWRTDDVETHLLAYVREIATKKRKMYFLEQDIMNLHFEGGMTLLDARYNLLTSIAYFDYDEVMKMKRPLRYYSRETIQQAKSDPAIIHGTTCFFIRKRMWVEDSDHPFAELYSSFRKQGPWRNDPRIPDARTVSDRANASFWHIMPRCISVSLASFAINHIRPLYADFASKACFQPIA